MENIMMYNLGGKTIEIRGKDYFIADSASVMGSVIIENNASIWYNASIRGDIEPIIIGEDSNVQDGCVLHTSLGFKVDIGKGVTVGHMAMLHGCTIGDYTLVGMNSILLDGARIGKNCIIGAGTLVTGGTEIPDNSLVLGSPGKVVKQVSEEQIKMLRESAAHYVEYFKMYKRELKVY
jgi:carbonic anhydrase/acetyltransferase-like protein (isoleucine patch superfamily)